MNAADIMTKNVISVQSDASVTQIAETLLSNGISAVPVVDDSGDLIGIVSEGDLVHRVELGTEQHPSWWLEFLAGKQALAYDYIKSHGRRAADLMTRPVVTVHAEASLSEIASLLDKYRIKRVPVVKKGKIVGIVSRANLVQALINGSENVASTKIADSVLRDNILKRLQSERWWPGGVNIIVHDGRVEAWGVVESEVQKNAIRVALEATPGVQAIFDQITVQKRMPNIL
jgi:CBS domain-containing protein